MIDRSWTVRAATLLFAVLLALQVSAANFAPIVDAIDPPLADPGLSDSAAAVIDATSGVEPWIDACGQCCGTGCVECQSAPTVGGAGVKLFGGIEYLEARPNFSEPLAFIRQARATQADPDGVTESVDQEVYFDFDRKDTLRAFIGLRQAACQSELRFTYWRLRSDDQVAGTAGTDGGTNISYTIWAVTAAVEGDQLAARSQLAGDVYDIQYQRALRRIDTYEPASVCCLPWSLDWSTGVRIVEWSRDTQVVSTTGTRADLAMEFDGAGPMLGLAGHRPLRIVPCTWLYTSFQTALLLGQYDHQLVRTAVVGPNTSREVYLAGAKRIVPVTEFEAGLQWQFGRYSKLSGGWFYQVWWDLGTTEDPSQGDVGLRRDDANIMAWDSLTVRAEFSF
jgi:hypothetical protein